MKVLFTFLALAIHLRALPVHAAEPALPPLPSTPVGLFDLETTWTVHLTFTPEQWKAMEPPPASVSFFGPGMMLGPALFARADDNRDGKLSKTEFHAFAERLFSAWDTSASGAVETDQIRAGIDAMLLAPADGSLDKKAFDPWSTDNLLLGGEGRRNGLASALGVEFPYVRATMEFNGHILDNVAVRYKGNGTWLMSQAGRKRSLKLDLKRFADGRQFAQQSQLNLHSNITDVSWMCEVMGHRLFRDAGVPAPRTAWARVFITVPDNHERAYFGLYSLVQDVGKSFVKDTYDASDGALFKPVTSTLFADLGDDWTRYRQSYDPKTEVSEAQTKRLIEVCRLVSSGTDEEFAAKIDSYLDLDAFSRFMAVNVWLCSLDGILGTGQNLYLYLHPRTGQFHFIPWDLDHAFGRADFMANRIQREQLSIQRPWVAEHRFLERVYKVEAFQTLYRERLTEFGRTIFEPRRLRGQVEALATVIRPAIQEESPDKLKQFERLLADYGGGKGFGVASLTAPLGRAPKPITPFIAARSRSIHDQLAGRSTGEIVGGGLSRREGAEAPGNADGKSSPGSRDPLSAGNFLSPVFQLMMDTNKDSRVSREEFVAGFDRWFDRWTAGSPDALTRLQLRAGLDRDLAPPPRPATQPAK